MRIDRRRFLQSCAALAATPAAACTWSAPKADVRQDLPPVTDFGAVGDGVTDDTLAFVTAAHGGNAFRVPPGSYNLGSSVKLKSGQSVYFDPGVIVRASAYMDAALFDAEAVEGVQIVGNGVTIDLNEATDKAVRISGSESQLGTRCRLTDVSVVGRSVTRNPQVATSAIELLHLDGFVGKNIQIDGYAGANSRKAEQGYSIGLFFCKRPNLTDVDIVGGNVGIEIYRCWDVKIASFSIRGCIDNGIYILSGSRHVHFSQGTIDACEEGVVIRSDDVTLSDLVVRNCSNKGVSMRTGDRCRIHMSHFESNGVHIGDDRKREPTKHLSVSNTTMLNARIHVINLTSTTDSDFDGIDVQEATATYDGGLIRLEDASRCSIRNSRFNNPGKTAPVFVRLSGDTQDSKITNNIFVEAATAIHLFGSASGTPSNIQVLDNQFIAVDLPVDQSSPVTGTVQRPGA